MLHSSFYVHRMKSRELASAEGVKSMNREILNKELAEEMGIEESETKWIK